MAFLKTKIKKPTGKGIKVIERTKPIFGSNPIIILIWIHLLKNKLLKENWKIEVHTYSEEVSVAWTTWAFDKVIADCVTKWVCVEDVLPVGASEHERLPVEQLPSHVGWVSTKPAMHNRQPEKWQRCGVISVCLLVSIWLWCSRENLRQSLSMYKLIENNSKRRSLPLFEVIHFWHCKGEFKQFDLSNYSSIAHLSVSLSVNRTEKVWVDLQSWLIGFIELFACDCSVALSAAQLILLCIVHVEHKERCIVKINAETKEKKNLVSVFLFYFLIETPRNKRIIWIHSLSHDITSVKTKPWCIWWP